MRLRSILAIASVANAAFILYDLGYTAAGYEADLRWLIGVRLTGAVVCALCRHLLRDAARPSHRRLEVFRIGLPIFLSAECAVMGLASEGLESTFGAGAIVMPVTLLACARRWRTNVAPALTTVFFYPATMLVAALFSSSIAAQLGSARLAFRLLSDTALCGLVALVCVIATHYYWQLRREHFESKAVGRYVLRRLLGKGGMGEVWAAWHPTLRREVGVKLLAGNGDAASVQRFEREVRATTELAHPNTIRVYDFGAADDGTLFYTMELLDGSNLAELVAREGPLSVARAVHLMRQAAAALAEAHARSIVHRDVKPENLFVGVVGGVPDFVKVLDFGIAKGGELVEVTHTARVVGSLTTISPEAAAGKPTLPASDVYSLGITLFFTLTGRYPFTGSTAALLFAHMQQVAPLLESLRPEVPEELAGLVARCLEKDPARRPANAGEVAAELALCAERRPYAPSLAWSSVLPRPVTHVDPEARTLARAPGASRTSDVTIDMPAAGESLPPMQGER